MGYLEEAKQEHSNCDATQQENHVVQVYMDFCFSQFEMCTIQAAISPLPTKNDQ
jgi:hypothetical protein